MITPDIRDRFGICQWFHFLDRVNVKRAKELLKSLGIKHLRTGISWADFHRPGGREWYQWMLQELSGFELLVSIWHTPPSLSGDGRCASPPRRLGDYADFVDEAITLYGSFFQTVELWNEPNNKYKWDFLHHDPQWRKFAEMVGSAAYWAKQRGLMTVLGGMMPVDPHWAALMRDYGVLEHIDKVGIHGFPGMWWPDQPNWDWYSHWSGWDQKMASLKPAIGDLPVWVTETGFATWDHQAGASGKHILQSHYVAEATKINAPRVYWYSLIDLDPRREAIEGFHVDENEYHLGLVTCEGRRKPAFHQLEALLEKECCSTASAFL